MFDYMAAGRAIISADLPVIHEVLNDENAVFCEPGNADAWESTLRELLADEPRRMSLGAQAREDVVWVYLGGPCKARAGGVWEMTTKTNNRHKENQICAFAAL